MNDFHLPLRSRSVFFKKLGWSPCARNNSPGIFSCIRAGANTGAACIRTERIPLRIWLNTRELPPHKYFPVFAQKLIPQEIFPACIGFVPGGTACSQLPLSVALLIMAGPFGS